MAEAIVVLRVKKLVQKLNSIRNLDLANKSDLILFFNLVVLAQEFAQGFALTNLLLLLIPSIVLFFMTNLSSFTKSSTTLILSIKISE